jgi:chromosomal replication initiator protein
MERFWLSCLRRLENELPAQQFNTWIKPLRLDSKTPSGQIALLAPNRFVLDWIKNRYLARIEAMAAEYFSSPIRVSLTMAQAGGGRSTGGGCEHPAGAAAFQRPRKGRRDTEFVRQFRHRQG